VLNAQGQCPRAGRASARTIVWRNTNANKSASRTDIAISIDALSVVISPTWADAEKMKPDQST